MKGILICLEGLDQAGKTSIANIVYENLLKSGRDAVIISFPDYTTSIGEEIGKFLEGKRSFSPEVRQLLYAANRFERKGDIERWLDSGKVVIANRYIPSGLAYGLANGLDLKWMLNLEKELPEAEITILIDVSAKIAYRRGEEKDIYERDTAFQERVRAAYLSLAKEYNWYVVNGEQKLEEVAKRVWEKLLLIFETENG